MAGDEPLGVVRGRRTCCLGDVLALFAFEPMGSVAPDLGAMRCVDNEHCFGMGPPSAEWETGARTSQLARRTGRCRMFQNHGGTNT
jgi:hypothetical protein